MTDNLRVGVVQLSIADGDPHRNLKRASALMGPLDVDLVVLPELWTSGYAAGAWPRIADRGTPDVRRALARLARERRCHVAGSMIARRETGELVNRLEVIGPSGTVAHYDKAHLFPPMAEDRHLAPGHSRTRVTLGGWTVALSLCYDLRFPEMYRLDAVAGADLFLVPAQWPAARSETLRLLARARAAENQAYLVLCNRTGVAGDGIRFHGLSAVIGPDGQVMAEAGDREDVISISLLHDAVRDIRSDLPVLRSRVAGVDTPPDSA